jgi:ligand-binding SRPBCC domain-containing protein
VPSFLRRAQIVPLDMEETFSFFADAVNLESITPPWLSFTVLGLTPAGPIAKGTLIDYRLRIRGAPVLWQSEITAWEPPLRFVDEQRRGPYRSWRHEHSFESLGVSTLVRDSVTYETPGGRLVDRFLVRPDLERIFLYRQQRLEEWAIARRLSLDEGAA